MRPLGYFAELENQSGDSIRGDNREGLIYNCVRLCAASPIYCFYAVFESDIKSNEIQINRKVIQEFSAGSSCWFALIKYNEFIDLIKSRGLSGYAATGDIVKYGSLTSSVEETIFKDNPHLAAFVKQVKYSHQQEYRLLVHHNLPMLKNEKQIEEYKSRTGEVLNFQMYDSIKIPIGNISQIAKKLNTAELTDHDDEHYKLQL